MRSRLFLAVLALVLCSSGAATAGLPLDWLIGIKFTPGEIAFVDPVTGAEDVVATGGLAAGAVRVIAGPGDQLYAATGADRTVLRIDPVTGAETIIARYGSEVWGLAQGPGSILYVGLHLHGVWRLDVATGLTGLVTPVRHWATGLRVDHRARVVALSQAGPLTIVEPATGSSTVLPGTDFEEAFDLALGRDGMIYIAQVLTERALVRYDPVTATQTVLVRLPDGEWPAGITPGLWGIEFGTDGFLYGAGHLSPDTYGLFRIDPATGAWDRLTPPDIDYTWRVSVIRETCDCVPDGAGVIDLPPGVEAGVPVTIEIRDAFGRPIGPAALGGALPVMRVDGPEPSTPGAKPRHVPMKFDGKRYRADLPGSFFKQPGTYVAAPIAGNYRYELAPTCLTRIVRKQ